MSKSQQRSTGLAPQAGPRFKFHLNGPLGVSLIAIALASLLALSALVTIASTAFSAGAGENEPSMHLAKLVAKHDEQMKSYQERFNGRSVFYKPPPKPRPQIEAPKVEVELPPLEPPKAVIPDKYQGPSPVWVLGDEAMFRAPRVGADPFVLRVGEEKNGVKFIASRAPWVLRLGYAGGEYDVPLFSLRDESVMFPTSARASSRTPGIVEVAEGSGPQMPPTTPAADGDNGSQPTTEPDEGETPDEHPDEGEEGEGEGGPEVEPPTACVASPAFVAATTGLEVRKDLAAKLWIGADTSIHAA